MFRQAEQHTDRYYATQCAADLPAYPRPPLAPIGKASYHLRDLF